MSEQPTGKSVGLGFSFHCRALQQRHLLDLSLSSALSLDQNSRSLPSGTPKYGSHLKEMISPESKYNDSAPRTQAQSSKFQVPAWWEFPEVFYNSRAKEDVNGDTGGRLWQVGSRKVRICLGWRPGILSSCAVGLLMVGASALYIPEN